MASLFDSAVEAAAQLYWETLPSPLGHKPPCECCSRLSWPKLSEGRRKEECREVVTPLIAAALPHIRAMIAEETANSWIPHRDELAQAIASGYEPDHPVPNRHDYKATDSVLRLLTAARNAEGNQP